MKRLSKPSRAFIGFVFETAWFLGTVAVSVVAALGEHYAKACWFLLVALAVVLLDISRDLGALRRKSFGPVNVTLSGGPLGAALNKAAKTASMKGGR